MTNKAEAHSGGIGFFGLLTIVFITLKLTNYIDWSWWWVLAPLWLPIVAFTIICLSIWIVGTATISVFDWFNKRK